MSTTYVYTLGVDLPSQVDVGALHESISTAFPTNNSYITLSGTSLTVKFTSALSAGEETTLSAIISQYNYSAPIIREYFEYPIQILDTTNAVQSGTTGALMVNGGAFITKDLYAANLYMGSDRVATESYVSGTFLTFGTGLTKTGNTVTVNSTLPHVTAVGTLTSLTVSGTATAQSTPTLSTHITNKGYVDALSYLSAGTGLTLTSGTLSINANQTQITTVGTLSGLTISGALSGSTATFSGTVTGATPTLTTHLTTKAYVDTLGYLTAGTGLTKTGSTLSVNASQTQITSVGTLTGLSVSGVATFSSTVTVPTPVNTTDATNKTYVDSISYITAGTGLTKTSSTLSVNASQPQITTIGTLGSLSISGALSGTTATFSGNVSVPVAPTLGSHVVNKDYVDSIASGISAKSSVVAASTTTVTLAGITAGSTLDGVTLASGNRILLKNQTTATENGIYVVQSSSSPVRSSDFATGADISGTFVFVEGGTVNASTGWVTTNTSGNDIVGTNGINWVQFSGTGQINAGNGLSKTGNTLDVNVDNTSLEIIADTLRISSGALGTGLSGGSGTTISVNASQPQITTVGTLSSLTVSGALSGSTATFSGVVIGATPTLSTHLTTKAYVDGISYITAGTGLTKTSSTLSVNASQTQITSVGTLTSLSVSGATTLTAGTASTTTSTGTLVVTGGIGVSGQVTATNLSGTLVTAAQGNITSVGTLTSLTVSGALSGSTATFSGVVIGATPTLSTHLTTKTYVDGISYITAGTGLTKTGSTLSVNASQTQITSVGTLTSLTVSGATTLTAGTASTTTSTGTLIVSGGIGVSGQVTATNLSGTLVTAAQGNITSVGTLSSLTISGALSGSTATFSGTVTGGTPTLSTHLTTKAYVDALGYLTAGTGLTLSSGTLSVNASQAQITSVGTLISLSVSGALSGSTATFSGTVTGATPTLSTHLTTKAYVDALGYLTAGTGLALSSGTLSVNASQTQITSVGTLTSLTLSGALSGTTATFTGNVSIPTAPTLGAHAVNKDYVDALISGISAKTAVVAASTSPMTLSTVIAGSTLDGVTLATGNRILLKNQTTATENGIYVVQPSSAPVRSSDFATGADISGTFVFVEGGTANASTGWVTTNTSGGDIVGTNAINWVQFSGTGQINAGNGLSKTGNTLNVNVDGTSLEIVSDTLRISSGALGTGLSGGSGTTISVNTSQPQITTVGTLTSLTISGALSGSTATFSGVVIGATPTLSTHLTTKAYVDSLSYLTAGTGLTLASGTLSVNASQTQITSVGTLTALNVSGATTLTAGTASTTTSTGTLIVTGGIGVSGQVTATTLSGTLQTAAQPNVTSLGTLSSLTISGALSGSTATFSGVVIGATPTLSTHLTTKAYVDALSYLTAGTGLTLSSGTLSVNASQTQITSVGTLTSLTVSGALSGSTATFSGVVIGATPTLSTHLTTKAYVDGISYITAGTGLTKSGSTLSVNASQITSVGTLTSLSVSGATTLTAGTASTTTSTGTLVVTGGIGVSGQVTASTLSGTLQTASQPNVTSVGTLTSLTVSGALSGSTATFSGVVIGATPTLSTHLTTKSYVDSLSYLTAGTGLTLSSGTLTVNASQPQITSVGTLTSLTISGALSGSTATFTGSVSIPTAPTLGSHAVNKDYVDSIASGISAKASVVASSTTAVTLASVIAGSTLDGVTLASGNRVLLKNQASATENGIYVVQSSGAPIRSSDFATGADISGTFVFVEGGTVNASSGWVTTNTSGSDIVGTNAINWVQFSGTGQINAGNGLSKTGNTLDVNVDGTSLEIVSDTLRISSGALGTGLSGGSGTTISVSTSQPQITSVGTLTSLTVSGALSGSTATFSGVVIGATPTLSTHLTTKAYVDGVSYITAGTGLTKTGSTLSVNSSQTQITSVGTLTSLSVSGATTLTAGTASTTTSTGTLVVTGGIGVSGQVTATTLSGTLQTAAQPNITSVGTLSSLTISGALSGSTATFSGTVTGATPTLSTHLTTKAYVDSVATVSAGTGLTLSSGVLSVNASQSQITTVGTLTSLTVSGATSLTAGTSSTGSGTGTLVVSGGVGISGFTFLGGGVKMFQSAQNLAPASKGTIFEIGDTSITNTSTASSGTLANYYNAYIGAPTLGASNTNVTTTNAASLYISGAPTTGTNNTITNTYSLWVGGGLSRFDSYINSISIDVANSNYLMYERQNLATLNRTLLQGNILGNASYVQSNGYIQLVAAVNNQNGYVEWQMTPGASWVCNFEYRYTGTGDFTHFYVYQSRSLSGTTGNNFGGIGIVLDDYNNRISYMSPSITQYSTGATYYLNGSYRSTYPASTWHSASVTFEMGILSLYINQVLIFSQTIDSNTLVKQQNTYLGFAGYSGGAASGTHWIRNMYMSKDPTSLTPSHAATGVYDLSPRIPLRIANTTDSTSPTTGALTVSGGLGVAKTAEFGAGVAYKTRLITSSTTVTFTDHMIAVDTTTGSVTVTLPSAATGTEGFEFKISKVTSDSNPLVIAPQSTESIGGAITGNWTLASQYASIHLISIGGGKWGIIAIQDPLNTNLSNSSSSLGDPVWSNSSYGAIDGTVTISSNTSLTRDMYYLNLTVNSGITLTSNGWRIFVYGTLTLNGKISNDGGNASGATAGIAPLTNHLGGGTNGANGRTGSGNGTNGVASPTANFLGGRGGQTYATGTGRNGANGGTLNALAESDGGANVMASFPYSLMGRCTGAGATGLCGGTGGASGPLERGTTSSGNSGGGGAGAGVVIVAARTITGSGSITANGGNGGNAAYTGSLSGTSSLCGGGGGGGGVVSVFYRFNTSTVTFTANGGSGGIAQGNGTNGQVGENGLVYVSQV